MFKTPIIFYDFETGSKYAETAQPTQLSAVVINPKTLTLEPQYFNSYVRPIFDIDECRKYGLDPLEQEALNITNITIEQLESAPALESVWKQFIEFVNQFNYKGGKWYAPTRAGFNNNGFDDIIVNRITGGHRRFLPKVTKKSIDAFDKATKDNEDAEIGKIKDSLNYLNVPEPYGFGPWDEEFRRDSLFHPIYNIDLMRIVWYWFENKYDVRSISMDSLREYFGITTKHSHNSLIDCVEGAEFLIRFLQLSRRVSPTINFQGSFKKQSEQNNEFNRTLDKFIKLIK